MEKYQLALIDILRAGLKPNACAGKGTPVQSACKGSQALPEIVRVMLPEIAEEAIRLGVGSLLYHILRKQINDAESGATPEREIHVKSPLSSLKLTYLANSARNIQIERELLDIAILLNKAHIPMIALKGSPLAFCIYEIQGLRGMADIDLMVPRNRLNDAWDILKAQGYIQAKPLNVETSLHAAQHLPIALRANTVAPIEIHWNITPPNQPYTIDPESLWNYSIPMPGKFGENGLRMFSPEHLLLHLCMHAAYIHEFAFDLRPFCDITQVLYLYEAEFNWQFFVEQAQRWHWANGVAAALTCAAQYFGAPVANDILQQLKPGGIDSAIIESALTQAFHDNIDNITDLPSSEFSMAWNSSSIVLKLQIIYRRLFISRAQMARKYGIPVTSYRLTWCYIHRAGILLIRYLPMVLHLARGDHKTMQRVDDRYIVKHWLAHD